MQNPYEKYKQQSVMTMTGGDMVNLLFETAIKRLNEGLACLEAKDYEGSNTAFQKAQNIFTHLDVTLDDKYDISKNLSALYEFFNYSIMQANMKKEPKPVEEILPMIAELKESFSQADKQVRIRRSGGDTYATI